MIVHFCTLEFNEFGFRKENVLRVKVGYFKKQCLANCDKMLNLANCEKLGINIQRASLYVLLKIYFVNIFTVEGN